MKITFIATGGTIDKDYPKQIKGYAFEFGEPAVQRILKGWKPNFEFEVLCPFQKDSLEITEKDREALMHCIKNCNADRFIITHGTDTMIETGKFLSEHISTKKIIITGAMRPERFSNSDAKVNVGGAVAALQVVEDGVYIFMSGILKLANVMKRSEEGLFH
ncbi:MAG: asparaginase domain-containing protein [Bacteroidota bacterium]